MNLTSKRMLKFMMVCAGACAFSATATTTWVSDSFEAPEGTNLNPIAWYKMSVSETGQFTNFLWTSVSGDASKLIASDAVNTGFADTTRPIPAANKLLVLNLETEGQTLSRSVTNSVDTTCSFDASSVYVDTLIKFTPSEDTPTIATGTKIAAYVNVNSNLVIYHKAYNGITFVETNSVTTLFINPTNWYRLTIEMNKTIDLGNPACKVRVNGTLITHANAFMDDFLTPGGSWFATASGGTTLSAVAFQGTGAVDELKVSDIPADFGGSAATYLTLMFTESQVGVTTSGVAVSSGALVKDPASVVITAKPWYEITGFGALFTGGDTTNKYGSTAMVTNINGVVTGSNGQTNTITSQVFSDTSSAAAAGWTGTYPINKVATWATQKAGGTTDLTGLEDNYLLNLDSNTEGAIKITNIVYNAGTTTATIKVAATNAAGIVNFLQINGALGVKTTDDLVNNAFAEPGNPTPYTVTETNATDVTITVPSGAGKFIKAIVK